MGFQDIDSLEHESQKKQELNQFKSNIPLKTGIFPQGK